MNRLFTTVLLLLAVTTYAMAKKVTVQNNDPIFVEEQVDKIPMYQNNRIAASKLWFLANLKELSSYSIDSMTIKFVIEKNGTISNLEVLNGPSPAEKEVKRVFKSTSPVYMPAMKNGEAVRYSISYDIYTASVKGSEYRSVTVYNRESYIHNITEIDQLPLTIEGEPLEDYVDIIMELVTPMLGSSDKELRFNLVSYKDGSMSTANMGGFPDTKSRMLVSSVVNNGVIKPALKDGKPVNYVRKFVVSPERLKSWSELSFVDELKKRFVADSLFNIESVTVLPRYKGTAIETYCDAIKEHVTTSPSTKGRVKGDVELTIALSKSGEIIESTIKNEPKERLAEAVNYAIKELHEKWSPAKIYNQSVNCSFDVTISF